MHLSDKHLFFTASSEMQELIKPLEKYNINYFTYNKNYLDGSRIRLTTNAPHLKAFLENEFYKTGNIDANPELYLNQAMLFSSLKNQVIVEWVRVNFQINNGIYIVRKSENYTEFFGFATSSNSQDMVNFYLNNLDFLQKFCDYFQDQGKSLIDRAEKNKLIHEYNSTPIEICEKADINSLLNTDAEKKLTPRQLDIALFLMQGKRAKEIAQSLHLSYRTIEDHIAILKNKYQARNMIELVIKINNQLRS
ncbi:hypothetical protein B1207_02320 [Legionella quinlivanii]|uniref:HTH luxR-type domain-containing protein n=1 Tax=Legionella quinlivanii TaxID=45073 RepID=A0A364LLU7_9GAMM|nr:LuxR family transcriptional regulator [Legionella quinlivanii]RAP37847.1 hypothetical protein B1207_02320 [Legionella quinlivanii]